MLIFIGSNPDSMPAWDCTLMSSSFSRQALGLGCRKAGERWLQSSSPFPSALVRHDVFPLYGAIFPMSDVASLLARTSQMILYNPDQISHPCPQKVASGDQVRDVQSPRPETVSLSFVKIYWGFSKCLMEMLFAPGNLAAIQP